MHLPATYLIVTTIATSAMATTGINCAGTFNCFNTEPIMKDLQNLIAPLDSNLWVSNGQQIACVGISTFGAICAYFQSSGGWQIAEAKYLIGQLVEYKCNVCGSVPADGKDVNNGMLTLNYVSNPCGNGVCPAFR